jgi:hypothetical protein
MSVLPWAAPRLTWRVPKYLWAPGLTFPPAGDILSEVTEPAVQPRERVAYTNHFGKATARDVCCGPPDSHLWASTAVSPSLRRGKVVTRVWTTVNLEVDACLKDGVGMRCFSATAERPYVGSHDANLLGVN